MSQHNLVNRVYDDLLTAFDVRIDEEKGDRDALGADNKCKSYHYHQGRIDGVDTGRALVEKVMSKFDVEPVAVELPQHWLTQFNKSQAQWEINEGLTKDKRARFIKTALEALCSAFGSAAVYFSVEVEINEWRKDDEECLLTVDITHHNEHLNQGNIWALLYVDESDSVFMMLGEDGDQEMELNSENLWSYAYLNAFCKPQ